jgi:hypothetical protein
LLLSPSLVPPGSERGSYALYRNSTACPLFLT